MFTATSFWLVGGIHYDDQLNHLCKHSIFLPLLKSSGFWLCNCRVPWLTGTPTNGFIAIMQRCYVRGVHDSATIFLDYDLALRRIAHLQQSFYLNDLLGLVS